MDGVLADFFKEQNAVARFENEKGFFLNLEPIIENVNIIKQLITNNESVRILSASPNERCDNEKIEWLKKYIPQLKRKNIIIMRIGQNKANFVKTKGLNILFDDYGRNCDEWNERKNHLAIKVKGVITL